LNTYRSAAAVLGTFVAVAMQYVAPSLGEGSRGYVIAGCFLAIWLTVPWVAVHRVSFERPPSGPPATTPFLAGLRTAFSHRAFALLVAVYVFARAAVDLIGAMFLFYFTYWIGRQEDFAATLALFLCVVVISLPVWLRVAQQIDKRTIYILGAGMWIAIQFPIYLAQPDWPRWTIFLVASLAGVGYAVADLMPWAMLGEVIDEDELRTGERREGLYSGLFTFIRKIAGSTFVALALFALGVVGYVGDGEQQPESAVQMVRILTSVAPAGLLLISIAFALHYPITRKVHADILRRLEERPLPD
ncbi:MAG: MFS transporter, partial [Proteobacteria bacterium]|nr:MFS transporter [Pseudomonadota bacterium]